MSPFDPARFVKGNTCLPCCSAPAPGCSCALLIPPFSAVYVDLATAQAAVDPANHIVADCLAYQAGDPTNITSLTASFDGTTFACAATWSSTTGSFGPVWLSLAAKSGATITMGHTGGDLISAIIYDCTGTMVETITAAAGPITSAALPADGEYYVRIQVNASFPFGLPFSACSISLISSDVIWVNPVIAQWDDSGTTRSLWACPKLLLPPLTEATGDWYASCASAAALIADYVSNCIGFQDPNIAPAMTNAYWSSTLGGSTLNFNSPEATPGDPFGLAPCWFSLNVAAGDIITLTYSGGTRLSGEIYDATGNSIEVIASSGGTFTSSALPYTGRIFVKFNLFTPFPGSLVSPLNVDITASGTLSVNPIQARYDIGLNCAATLDCGDACP